MIASVPDNRSSLQTMWRFALFAFSALCAWLLVFPNASSLVTLLAKIGFTGLLAGIAVQDFRTRTVSPAITLGWMLMGLLRALVVRDLSFLPYWLGIFWLWTLHFYGGGDAKLLMGITGLWSDPRLIWIMSGVLLVLGLPLLVLKYWRKSPRIIATGVAQRIASGTILPTDDELNRGVPFAFAYCLAAAVYLWTLL